MDSELTEHAMMPHQQETTMEVIAGGSIAEAIGGIGAVVLAILGLLGLLPRDLGAIAAIAVGVGLLLESTAVATRLSDLLPATEKRPADVAKLGGGVGTEFLGGVAGGVLGLLALLGIAPLTLMAIAVIVFGASLLLSSRATYRVDMLASKLSHKTAGITRAVVAIAASGIQLLVGVAAIALGIIALAGVSSMIIVLVGLLSVGAAVLISGGTVSGSVMEW